MQENELKAFVKENSILIYKYINSEILKDIGVMSSSFFVRLIDEYFNKDDNKIDAKNLAVNTFGYYLITEILGDAKQAFPFFRKDTMTLEHIFKEAKVYFNHVNFSVEDDKFKIILVQTKAGVSTLEEEIIKFEKQFPIKTSGFKEFVSKNSHFTLDENAKELKKRNSKDSLGKYS